MFFQFLLTKQDKCTEKSRPTGKYFVPIPATHRRLDKTGLDLFSPQRQGEVEPGESVRGVFDKLFLRTRHSHTETYVSCIYLTYFQRSLEHGVSKMQPGMLPSHSLTLEIHTLNSDFLSEVTFFICFSSYLVTMLK